MHRLWLIKGVLRSEVTQYSTLAPDLQDEGQWRTEGQAAAPTPIGHDTPVPPNPQ